MRKDAIGNVCKQALDILRLTTPVATPQRLRDANVAVAPISREQATEDVRRDLIGYSETVRLEIRELLSIDIVDGAGRILISTDPSREGTSVADALWFRKGLQRVSVAEVVLDGPRAGVWGAMPLGDPRVGQPSVVAVRFDPVPLIDASMTPGELGQTGESFIVGVHDGAPLALTRRRFPPNGASTVDDAWLRALLDAPKLIPLVVVDDRGRAVVATREPIASTDWHLVVKQDASELFAGIRRFKALMALVMATSLLVAAVALHYAVTKITRPIRELVAATKALGAGRMDVEVAIPDIGELSELATSFNQMVSRLRDSQESLSRASEELSRLAAKDGLTGIANRRQFDERFAMEWRRALREGQAISLIMVDIDFFKHFNDALGHLAGDEALRKVAKTLEGSASRPADVTARYGGEEFAILLPGADEAGARWLAESARQRIEALGIEHPDSAAGPYLTVSVGVATARPLGLARRDLLHAADSALYEAKRLGRNRVVTAPQVVDGMSSGERLTDRGSA
jgi:diguanylate cyclase (GGDEF)-like protein